MAATNPHNAQCATRVSSRTATVCQRQHIPSIHTVDVASNSFAFAFIYDVTKKIAPPSPSSMSLAHATPPIFTPLRPRLGVRFCSQQTAWCSRGGPLLLSSRKATGCRGACQTKRTRRGSFHMVQDPTRIGAQACAHADVFRFFAFPL